VKKVEDTFLEATNPNRRVWVKYEPLMVL